MKIFPGYTRRGGGESVRSVSGKEIYEWIIERKLEIKEELGQCIKDEKVIRLAIETWLLLNGHITVARNGEVLPYLREQNLS